MSVTIMNLATGKTADYTCSPREAVIAAYAQARGDHNTWDYATRYGHLVTVSTSGHTVSCGDFAAYVTPTTF